MREKVIVANWKMNTNFSEATSLIKEIKTRNNSSKSKIIICPPSIHISLIKALLAESPIEIGIQNINENIKGAFTGELSVVMLADYNVKYAIVGHSERRSIFKESDELINQKVKSCLNNNIKAILCVGETLAQRKSGTQNQIISQQLKMALNNVKLEQMQGVIIAYEPVWAIGTGKTAQAEDADEVHCYIREFLSNLYKQKVGENLSIIYGGSVKDTSIDQIMSMENIDGVLVGGASLISKSFNRIIDFQSE